MRYPIAIESGDAGHAFSVVVPDLSGCFSAGDTLDKAIDNVNGAIDLWLETVIDAAAPSPKPAPFPSIKLAMNSTTGSGPWPTWIWRREQSGAR